MHSRIACIRYVRILRTRHNDLRPRSTQEFLRAQSNGKRDILFTHAGESDRPRVTAPMPGINNYGMPLYGGAAEDISAIGKEFNDKAFRRLCLCIFRNGIDAIGICAGERLPRINAQGRTAILTRNRREFFRCFAVESNLSWKILVKGHILKFNKELIVLMSLRRQRINEPRPLDRNLNAQRRTSIYFRRSALNMRQAMEFPLCLTCMYKKNAKTDKNRCRSEQRFHPLMGSVLNCQCR